MVRFASFVPMLAVGIAAFAAVSANMANSAVEPAEPQQLAEARPTVHRDGLADVELRFVQEDGPDSGHLRVELTPSTRALTAFEVRAAAQQGFLEALNETGPDDHVRRITVVVRLVPQSRPEPVAEQVFRFVHKGGRDWSVLAGE